MAYGQKAGSLRSLKKTLAKGGSGGAWIKYIPKNGSMNVRFIQEPEEFVNYIEHFDTVARKSYPCNGEASCPGCRSDERKTARYLTNVVDLDNGNRVIALQLPKDLTNRIVVKYEKWGSITDRDIELSRSGEGLDTVYDLDAGPVDRRSIAKYTPLDLDKVLEDAFNYVFGPDEDDADDEDTPTVQKAAPSRGRKKSAAASVAKGGKAAAPAVDDEDDVDEDAVDEDEVPAKPAKKSTKKAAPPEPKFEVEDEDEPDDDEDDEDDEGPDAEPDDDEVEYDEDTLRALPLGALRSVARDFGVVTKGKDADTIIAEIMESGDEVDDEDEPAPY